MRRATARGRMLPQSLSTDARYGRLCLKAQVLYPLLWVNGDDQGRLCGDPDEIKYAVCPSIRDITPDDIPSLLGEMAKQGMISLYSTSKTKAIQMLDWWEENRLQWAWPSTYPPPQGWQDRLRYKKSAKEVVVVNWPGSPEGSPESSPGRSPESSPERSAVSPLTTPYKNQSQTRRGRGRGRSPEGSPECSGERSPPTPAATTEISTKLHSCYESGWGMKTGAREAARLRDLATELSAAGCSLDYIDEAFREAAAMNKLSISYVRAVLLDWLGVPKVPP